MIRITVHADVADQIRRSDGQVELVDEKGNRLGIVRRPPTDEARRAFLGEVCPGMRFDTAEDWVSLYAGAGLTDIEVRSGPFEMMTPRGFLADEGLANSVAVVARTLASWTYLKRMAWLMPRIGRAVPYLGYLVVAGTRPG